MAIIEPLTVPGFRDVPAGECMLRGEIIDRIARLFTAYGFSPFRTPVLERASALQGVYGPELDKQIFHLSAADQKVAMRYDLTVPLARFAAQNIRTLPLPVKRSQIGSVFRARETEGRTRELLQADADIIGTRSRVADAECVALMYAVMAEMKVPAFTIRVNSRKLYRGLQNLLGISSEGQYFALMRTLNRLGTQDESAVRAALETEVKFSPAKVEKIFEYLTLPEGAVDAQLTAIEERFGGSELARHGIGELREIFSVATALGVPESAMVFDLFTTRSLDYYTSTVFKTDIDALPKFGSVISGGRYDDLGAMFAGQIIPAVGISVRVDRLIEALAKLDLRQPQRIVSPAQVFVMVNGREQLPRALKIVTAFRAANISCDFSHDVAASEAQQLRHAQQLAIPFVLTFDSPTAGADDTQPITLSSIADGTQAVVTISQAIEALQPQGV